MTKAEVCDHPGLFATSHVHNYAGDLMSVCHPPAPGGVLW